MFNRNTVASEYITKIGWRKSLNPGATMQPMGDLLTASTGQYYNDEHPYMKTDVIKSIAPDFSTYTYSAWSSGTTYAAGDIVTSGGNHYVSLVNSNLNHAVGTAAYWRQTNPYNEWLRNLTINHICSTFDDIINKKFKRNTAANLLKRSQVINAPGTKAEPVGDTERYVCWAITPSPLLDIIVKIDRISIQMVDSEQTIIELYKNGGTTPISTVTIEGDGTSDVIWADAGWELERGNFYYLAIDRDSISAEPINALAGMTIKSNFSRFENCLPFAEVSGFQHAGPGETGWDDVEDIRTNLNNYGLNVQFSARCDYSQLFIDQSDLFIPVVKKRVVMGMIREIALNPPANINRIEKNIDKNAALYEIDGNPMGRKTGLGKDYEEAINAVMLDSRTLSKHCLPCREDHLEIGSI